MSITEYILVAVAGLCILASFVLFVHAKSEQIIQINARDRRAGSDRDQLAPPDRYGFRRMGHCLPWW
jgi:hypothetical protein